MTAKEEYEGTLLERFWARVHELESIRTELSSYNITARVECAFPGAPIKGSVVKNIKDPLEEEEKS